MVWMASADLGEMHLASRAYGEVQVAVDRVTGGVLAREDGVETG